jgi:hypothetical protein
LAHANARVALIPDDRERIDLYRTVTADAQGSFALRGIPTGKYKLFVLETSVQAYAFFNKEFLRSIETSGRDITIEEGVEALRVVVE